MPDDQDLEEKLMQVAFSEAQETSPEIFAKLGRTLRDGELLFSEGERSTELIMIVSGMCKITKVIGGAEKDLATLKAGEILGEMSHFDDAPRSATARAVGTLNVLSFARENFGMIFELHHKWTLHLIQALATRIHGTFKRLVAAHDTAPAPQAPARPAGPAVAERALAGYAVEKLEQFVTELRSALGRGAAIASLKAKAMARYPADQRGKVEELFAYAERRLRREGLIA
jgi:CRP-like cAMP-binding protein